MPANAVPGLDYPYGIISQGTLYYQPISQGKAFFEFYEPMSVTVAAWSHGSATDAYKLAQELKYSAVKGRAGLV